MATPEDAAVNYGRHVGDGPILAGDVVMRPGAGNLALSRPEGNFHFDAPVAPPPLPPPPPPPPAGAPVLPVGTIIEGPLEFTQMQRWQGFAGGLPNGVGWYEKDPGPGTNQFWPGNLGTIDPSTGAIVLTSEWQGGRVANAGVGFWGKFTAPGAIDLVAQWDSTPRENLDRYALTWTRDGQERDHLEGVPPGFGSHAHQWPGNANPQNGPSWSDELGVWLCYRILVLASGMQTYSGTSWSDLVLRSSCGYASGVMSTAQADFDIAQEAEGPMVAGDFATPCVDQIAAVALYALA